MGALLKPGPHTTLGLRQILIGWHDMETIWIGTCPCYCWCLKCSPSFSQTYVNDCKCKPNLGPGNVPRPAWIKWWKLSLYWSWARLWNFNTFVSRKALRGRTWVPWTWGLRWSPIQIIFLQPFGLGCAWCAANSRGCTWPHVNNGRIMLDLLTEGSWKP